jgi:hypothetical protein
MPTTLRRGMCYRSKLPSLLLITGSDAFTTQLVARQAASRRERVVAHVDAPMTISAAGHTQAVTGLIEAADRLSLISEGRLTGVPTVGRPMTPAVAISERDGIYWVEAKSTHERGACLFRYRDGSTATLYCGSDEITHLTLAGRPDAPVIVSVSSTGNHLVHFDPEGTVRTTMRIRDSGVSGFVGSERHDLVAISFGPNDPGQLLDIAAGEQRALLGPGWRPLSWTPDGRYCLLARIERLQLIDMRTNSCRELPSARQPVFDASWVTPAWSVPTRRAQHRLTPPHRSDLRDRPPRSVSE